VARRLVSFGMPAWDPSRSPCRTAHPKRPRKAQSARFARGRSVLRQQGTLDVLGRKVTQGFLPNIPLQPSEVPMTPVPNRRRAHPSIDPAAELLVLQPRGQCAVDRLPHPSAAHCFGLARFSAAVVRPRDSPAHDGRELARG